ncbi:tRNA delta(2)-isopentenylpyrophosphate transferase [Azospirillum thiophilum]|uniref:tRNA dimethylallyltransferase n=1 Tax=Azospirillum thiophilum TaxID=528244 RepID=A0AAC8ZTY9_9PROT|nr:tRNA (adenosine(37)-N6)-dimethylallyltransferase MiaA [Azospirillum thiophilum]ALG70871.1 tRNA delta(2)-isopentenylpyrophosphate transferase [Azospirillum thiophilum]KJR65468.1 tRNA delta(2)-isopentenylpyrophosphate transferase [Azospirillum thiophilum]
MEDLDTPSTNVIVIGGPTASGKSGLALAIAEAFGGTVINADSMQLYGDLDLLTARPPAADLARAPHRLYGVLPAAERGSAARWRDMALAEIAEAKAAGRLPVVVGGTGLYLRALMQGLSEVPAIPDDIRAAAHARLAAVGGELFRAELVVRDPASAKLNPGDTTRLTRAWEVLEATGRPLSHWQSLTPQGAPEDLRFIVHVLDPPRADLYAQCDRRFELMMEQGALEEVRRLDMLAREQELAPDLPVLKALGVPELRRFLHGDIALQDAVALAQQSTRRYAKRQVTWFRHQMVGKAPDMLVSHTGQHSCHTIDSPCSEAVRNAMLDRLRTILNY